MEQIYELISNENFKNFIEIINTILTLILTTTALYFTSTVAPASVVAMKSLKSTVYVTLPLAATAVAFDSATVTGFPAILTLSSTKLSAYKPVEVSITLKVVKSLLSASFFEEHAERTPIAVIRHITTEMILI